MFINYCSTSTNKFTPRLDRNNYWGVGTGVVGYHKVDTKERLTKADGDIWSGVKCRLTSSARIAQNLEQYSHSFPAGSYAEPTIFTQVHAHHSCSEITVFSACSCSVLKNKLITIVYANCMTFLESIWIDTRLLLIIIIMLLLLLSLSFLK